MLSCSPLRNHRHYFELRQASEDWLAAPQGSNFERYMFHLLRCLCDTNGPAEMFTNQVPQFPDFARNLEPTVKPSFVNSASEIYPQAQNPPQGWGLSFFTLLHPGPTGRSANTVFWTGLANLVWWADVENGIGGIMASQILPFGGKEDFPQSYRLYRRDSVANNWQTQTSLIVTLKSKLNFTQPFQRALSLQQWRLRGRTNNLPV